MKQILKQKRKTKKKKQWAVVSFIMLLLFLLPSPVQTQAAQEQYISDLAAAVGENGFQELEAAGYSVLGRPVFGEIWLGYKKGGTPITGLVISSGGARSVEVNGISYKSVCSLGGAGTLCATHDGNAGAGILGFSLQSYDSSSDQSFYALQNNGTVPLRYDSGQPCDLGADDLTYLLILSDNICRPYISSATAVSGEDLAAAILKAAEAGNTYYYYPGLKTNEGETIVIGYNRTADESQALTCLTADAGEEEFDIQDVTFRPCGNVVFGGEKNYRLFAAKDRKAGNPIIELTGSDVPVRSSDVMNKWIEKVFVKINTSPSAVSKVKGEQLYQQLLSDSSALTHVPVIYAKEKEEVKTQLAYTCKEEGMPEESIFEQYRKEPEEESESKEVSNDKLEEEQETDLSEITETNTEETPVEEEPEMSDTIETPETENPEEPEQSQEQPEEESSDIYAASVFGNGTARGILFGVIALIAVGIIGFLSLSRNHSSNTMEGNDDEEKK